jgi:hypothetical protein
LLEDTQLFDCSYVPNLVPALSSISSFRNEFASAFPEETATLDAIQNEAEVRGGQIWFFISGEVSTNPGVRETLWAVNNGFLEVVATAGLLNLGAQVTDDLTLGRKAVLAANTLTAWLASYQLGLEAPNPRTLPAFDLGTTPFVSAY